MDEISFHHIVVEGPIGVGKTSLAKRLATTFGRDLLLEMAEANPFLERFYQHPRQTALATQLFFLFQRAQQLQEIRQDDMFKPVRVSDFLMAKDKIFAELTLDEDEIKIYKQVYNHLTIDAPKPDLVIYLQAPAEVLRKRVTKRGIDYEQIIEINYLRRLVDAYTQFFHYYDDSPLLIVNAQDVDFVNSEKDYQDLLARLVNVKQGRHYFNPLPLISD